MDYVKLSVVLMLGLICFCEASSNSTSSSSKTKRRQFGPGVLTSVVSRQVQFGPVSFEGPVEGGPCREVDGEANMRSYPGNPNWILQCAPVAWPNFGRWVRMPCPLNTWFFEPSQRCEHPGTTGVILPSRTVYTGYSGPFGNSLQSASNPVNPGMCPDGSVAAVPCDRQNLCPSRYFCSPAAGCCQSQAGQCPPGYNKVATWGLCDASQPCPVGSACIQGICCYVASPLG